MNFNVIVSSNGETAFEFAYFDISMFIIFYELT